MKIAKHQSATHKGKLYYTVSAAARLLSTSQDKIKQAMGRGELEWVQLRAGGRIFIPAASIVAYNRRRAGRQ